MSHHHHHVDQHVQRKQSAGQHAGVELTIHTSKEAGAVPPAGGSVLTQLGASNQQKLCCGASMHKNDKRLIQMILLFTAIIVIGGLIFSALEEPAELAMLEGLKTKHLAAKKAVLALLGNNQTLFDLLAKADAEDAFVPHPDYTDVWSFASASLFAFTVVTTIGYGTFAPTTPGGRIFLVLYAMVGIPAAGITLVFVAERALNCVTKCFTMRQDKVKKAFEAFDEDDSGNLDLDEFREAIASLGMTLTDSQYDALVLEVDSDGSGEIDLDEFSVAIEQLNADVTEAAGRSHRIKIVVLALFVWIGIGCLVLCLVEQWTVDEGIYFSFVTLTTVGLGDIFPATTGGRAFLILYAMVGLGELAILLSLIEGLLADWDKARKIAIEKARKAAIRAREAGRGSGGGGGGGGWRGKLANAKNKLTFAGAMGKKKKTKEKEDNVEEKKIEPGEAEKREERINGATQHQQAAATNDVINPLEQRGAASVTEGKSDGT